MSLKANNNINIFGLSKDNLNGMSEKNNNIIEEEKNNINDEKKEDLFDIKNMTDPLSALKEVEEKEINEKYLTDLSKEINKKYRI